MRRRVADVTAFYYLYLETRTAHVTPYICTVYNFQLIRVYLQTSIKC